MADSDVEPQLLLLRRQYFQLFEPGFLALPPARFLKDADVQKWLYRHLFDQGRNPRLPPERYQVRVLKKLVARIEEVVDDLKEDGNSNELLTCLKSFIARGVPSEFQAAQEKAYVTYVCLRETNNSGESYLTGALEPTITLLERRHLISGSQTTGFRTWEASLHLGSYFLTSPGSRLVRGKNVLELGAGTGFLTILLAKHLRINHITTTDGDGEVIEAMKENLALNDLNNHQKVKTRTLIWGGDLGGTWVRDDCDCNPYDIVIGADVIYDKVAISALVLTLHNLFELRPSLRIIIAGAVRNAEILRTFREECVSRYFAVEDIEFEPKPMRQQESLFYATVVPIRIFCITRHH